MENREIERKFLVCGEYESFATHYLKIEQGYLSRDPDRSVRVRIIGLEGKITVKGKSGESMATRFEWESDIPVETAREMILMCLPGIIEKVRYFIPVGNHTITVDRFIKPERSEEIAEIELSEEDEEFLSPDWLGAEVTGNSKYYNSNIY